MDSFSHAWNNEGGILDVKDRIAAQQGKNSYTAWNEAGKVQNSLVNTILAVDCHTIVTMRSKMEYVMQENERGKTQPVKVGLAPVQRDDTEYEFCLLYTSLKAGYQNLYVLEQHPGIDDGDGPHHVFQRKIRQQPVVDALHVVFRQTVPE